LAVIEVRGLRKEFGRRGQRTVALDGIDFEVSAGSVFGFLGPNGAGKTTTIRCLLNLARPTAGHCTVLGVDPQTHFERIQRRVGSLIENQSLFGPFSGRRNLGHLARLQSIPVARVDAVLDQVGLSGRAHDPVRTYSQGMRQRLGLAAALLKDPEVLVLDEPANGLDPEGIVEIRSLLRGFAAQGRTVFVSSHQLGEVQQLCDHVAVLAGGRCVAAGPVDEVLALAGSSDVLVRIDDVDRAVAVLRAAGWGARIDGNATIRVAVPASDAPLVAEALGRQHLWPRELRPAGAGLEEAFLALTRPPSAGPEASPSRRPSSPTSTDPAAS
jgi:ABC-2 type transport system ATP-binding protein